MFAYLILNKMLFMIYWAKAQITHQYFNLRAKARGNLKVTSPVVFFKTQKHPGVSTNKYQPSRNDHSIFEF